MTLDEVITRVRFTKHLYEVEIIKMLNQRNIPEAKKDIRALGITLALLEERKKQYGGSEEIYTK